MTPDCRLRIVVSKGLFSIGSTALHAFPLVDSFPDLLRPPMLHTGKSSPIFGFRHWPYSDSSHSLKLLQDLNELPKFVGLLYTYNLAYAGCAGFETPYRTSSSATLQVRIVGRPIALPRHCISPDRQPHCNGVSI